MNFHGNLHVASDILNFGSPNNVNTRSDEHHHIRDKKSAKRTQKRPGTFDLQSLNRIEDRRVIDVAMEELKGGVRWRYYDQSGQSSVNDAPESSMEEPTLTGVKAIFYYNLELDGWTYEVNSKMKAKTKYKYTPDVVSVIGDVVAECNEYITEATIYSELWMNEGQRYRAAPH